MASCGDFMSGASGFSWLGRHGFFWFDEAFALELT